MSTDRICPECRAILAPDAGGKCAEHDRHGVELEALPLLDVHPLLGFELDEKYALIGVLGRGGTGSVYRALQLPLGRPVGVKLLHSGFLSARDGRDRFEREARALASLSSLNTVRLLDYGITRQGPPALRNIAYLVMELLEGEDLEVRMKRGPMAPVEVLALLDALADSLDEAHAAGVVHRDLKPSNIVLTHRRDGREVPKLIDFGIARIDGGSQTESGRVSGTPLYMAPEQARGDNGQGPAADVYSAGALCFELLTGRAPFNGASAAAVMMAHCQAVVPPLDPTGADPVFVRLDAVLRVAMAKEPAERYGTLGAMRDAMARALEPESTAAPDKAEVEPAATEPEPIAAPEPEESDAPADSGESVSTRSNRSGVLIGGALLLGVSVGVVAAFSWEAPPTQVAFGVAEPSPTSAVGLAVETLPPAGTPATTAQSSVSAAGPPASAPPASAPPSAKPETRPKKPADRPVKPKPDPPAPPARLQTQSFVLGDGKTTQVPIEAGTWRVVVEAERDGDPITVGWRPPACDFRGLPGTHKYRETCRLDRPGDLIVRNPSQVFGSPARVRVTWSPIK